MDRWTGRVAIVTGASSGIGAAIAKELTLRGMKVVGLARRVERIQEIADSLKDAPGKLYALKADITKEEDILSAFKWVKENLGGVDVMINNAGVVFVNKLSEGDTAEWKQMFDVNVLALSICTREAIKSMKERGVDDGHIIHINSVAGHSVEDRLIGILMYTGSKHAVTALTEGLRKELSQQKSKIRVTSISPGAVRVERVDTMPAANLSPEMLEKIKDMPKMEPIDLAEAVIFALSRPAHVQVHEITLHPTGEK